MTKVDQIAELRKNRAARAEAASSQAAKGTHATKPERANKAKATGKASQRAPKSAHDSGGEKTIRPGSKLEIIADLLRRPEGCTTADILKATDWPAVSVPQQARAAGIKLRKEKRDRVTVYFAA